MCSGVARAAFWKPSYMFAQLVALFGDGDEPPPDRIDPSRELVMSAAVTDARSAWVIWPIFSSSDIRGRRSATRVETGRLGSSYGNASAGDAVTTSPAAVHSALTATVAAVRFKSVEGTGERRLGSIVCSFGGCRRAS